MAAARLVILLISFGGAFAVYRCRHPGGVLACLNEVQKDAKTEQDEALHGLAVGDAEDCAQKALVQRSDASTAYVDALTCGLPALFSLELLYMAWAYRRFCTEHAAQRETHHCSSSFMLAEVAGIFEEYRALLRASAIDAAVEIRDALRSCMDEYDTSNVWPTLVALYAQSTRGEAETSSIVDSLLSAVVTLAWGRRVLQWRANALVAVTEFGLAAALPRLKLRSTYLPSRVEMLLELLDAPHRPARFVEVGVHLGRLSFAVMSSAPAVHYIGVDPYSYSSSTGSDSIDRQLRDLGHQGLSDAAGLSEAQQAAADKFRYFGSRAELWVMTSVAAAQRVPDRSLDGIFIDGDHSYRAVVEDLAAWEPKVRLGGFLSGHDFGNTADVARAVVEHAERHNRTIHLAMDWVWYWHVL